jgi:hypothetical protein
MRISYKSTTVGHGRKQREGRKQEAGMKPGGSSVCKRRFAVHETQYLREIGREGERRGRP